METLSSPSHVSLVHVLLLFVKTGAAPWSRVAEVGARKAQWTAGPPASAVLQPDAVSVGLDAEADRCHLKGNQRNQIANQQIARRTQRFLGFINRTHHNKADASVLKSSWTYEDTA